MVNFSGRSFDQLSPLTLSADTDWTLLDRTRQARIEPTDTLVTHTLSQRPTRFIIEETMKDRTQLFPPISEEGER